MAIPSLKEIEQRLLDGRPQKSLEGLLEWVSVYLPDEKTDVIATLARLNKASQDVIRNLISQDRFEVEYANICLVVQDILSKCRHSGVSASEGAMLQPHHRFTCDRMPQNDKFQQSRESFGRKARFFYLYGEEHQSHEGFFQRICLDLKGSLVLGALAGEPADRQVKDEMILFDPSSDPSVYRANLLKELFGAFGVPVNLQEPLLDKKLQDLVEKSPLIRSLGPADFVCVLILINEMDWHPVLTPELARWFIYEFAREDLPAVSPCFYFFLGVEFEGFDEEVRRQVETALEERQTLQVLPELNKVEFNDIKRWFNKYRMLAPKDKKRDSLMESHFQKNNLYDMEDVEGILEKLIHEFNNRHL